MKKIVLIVVTLLSMVTSSVYAQFVHPGVIFNTEDLERMKNNINVEPWKTGYEIILDDEKSSFNYQMQGPFAVVDRLGQNFGQFNNDADAIYYQSIQYYITSDNRYAENAVEMIEAWASTIEHIGGNVPALAAADRGLRILAGCEILRYTYSGWTNNLSNITEDFAREVLLPPLYLPDITRVANQGASQIDAVIALSVYINDQVLFNQAINAFLNEPCAGITNTTASGMNGDTGRDYGHAFGMVNNLASAAESAYKQGVDLFSVLDNRVLAITEYWNAYGLGINVPFTPYGTCYDYFETIGSNGRGGSDFNTNKLLEIVQGAYTVRMGIPSPYTTQRINDIPVSEHTFFFKKDNSGITGATVPGAPYEWHTGTTNNSLTNIKIGGGSTGSSSFNGNTWTIVGNGDVYGLSNSDGCQLAYHQLDREGTIIAKINSINSSNSNAKVGLMFRESLDADSRMFAAYAHNSGGLEVTFRNQSVVNTDNVAASQINLNSFDEVNFSEGWVKIEINDGRVSGFYSTDKVIWVPLGTAIFNNLNNMYLGLFAGSHNNANGTGVFSDVEIFTNESTSTITPTSSSFTPDPSRTYYIDSPIHNLRLASTGSSEDAYTTSTNTTGADVQWQFVSNGIGGWYLDRAEGGILPRLRTDGTEAADMQSTQFDGAWETYTITPGASNNTYFLTIPGGPNNLTRLQVNSSGYVHMVPSNFAGSWESFTITEAGFVSGGSSSVVHITKANAAGFAIDGNHGGENEQNVYLWNEDNNNVNQQWIEINRGNGYYSYQKQGTNFCIDGNGSGENGQSVYLWECSDSNQNQHWLKVSASNGSFQLVKRNAPEFALDGGNGGATGQDVYLWSENINNGNQQWFISPVNTSAKAITDITSVKDIAIIYPNPVVSIATITGAVNSTVRVYDITGAVLFTKDILSNKEQVDLSALATGVYYAQIEGVKSISVIKIVKQ